MPASSSSGCHGLILTTRAVPQHAIVSSPSLHSCTCSSSAPAPPTTFSSRCPLPPITITSVSLVFRSPTHSSLSLHFISFCTPPTRSSMFYGLPSRLVSSLFFLLDTSLMYVCFTYKPVLPSIAFLFPLPPSLSLSPLSREGGTQEEGLSRRRREGLLQSSRAYRTRVQKPSTEKGVLQC